MNDTSQSGNYIAPNLKVVELQFRSSILQTSGEFTQEYTDRTDTGGWWQEIG